MICCVVGHRPEGFPFLRDDYTDERYSEYLHTLGDEVLSLIERGFDCFISGMAEGADIDLAYAVIYYRDEKKYPVTLKAVLPCPCAEKRIVELYSDDASQVLSRCDEKILFSEKYSKGCKERRTRFIIDEADAVLAIWDGGRSGEVWDAIKYAKAQKKQIIYIMLNELEKK